jgi:hypothetical protein
MEVESEWAAPLRVASVMGSLDVWWAVAGGWAIDLWLGRVTREHHDVEVSVRRSDQPVIHRQLVAHWEMSCIDPPGSSWRAWDGHALQHPTFQARARRDGHEFDLFFEDVRAGEWSFRRDRSVHRPVAATTQRVTSGLPIMRPEIQLLYMARHAEPKNQADFATALPELDASARAWLRESLARVEPGHPWIAELDV